MLRIRLQRMGRRNRAYFRIVVADGRAKRQGAFLENLGHYDPHGNDQEKVKADLDRVRHWVGQGAQMSDRVNGLLKKRGLQSAPKPANAAASK